MTKNKTATSTMFNPRSKSRKLWVGPDTLPLTRLLKDSLDYHILRGVRARAVAPRTHRVCACTCMHMRMHIYRTINNSLHLARDLVSHPRAPDADGLALGVEERHLEPPGLPADLDAARQCEQ